MEPALCLESAALPGLYHWFGSANGVPCSVFTRDLDRVFYARPILTSVAYGVELVDQYGQAWAFNSLARTAYAPGP